MITDIGILEMWILFDPIIYMIMATILLGVVCLLKLLILRR